MRRWAIVAALLLASSAQAGNSVSSVTATVSSRNLTSVAIKAIVSGDDDSTAVLRLFQRYETQGAYDSGMVMVRRVGTNIHEGRILWMTQGRTANWQIEVTESGQPTFRTREDTVSCAQIRPNVATGPVFYVDQATGDDSDDGSTPALAKKTIAAARTAMMASTDSGAFGGIFVAPGHYHERVDLMFGTDGKPRFFSGNRVNRDSTIICGANEHSEAGRYAEAGDISWVVRPRAAAVAPNGWYHAYIPDGSGAESDAGYGDSLYSVILNWGEILHRKTSLAALFADSTGSTGSGLGVAGGDSSGWWWGNDTLYVRRSNKASPAGTTPHFGYRNYLVMVGRRNWRVANLTMRYAATLNDLSNGAEEDPGSAGEGINGGHRGGNYSGLVVDSVRVYGCTGIGIHLAWAAGAMGLSASQRGDSCVVANSYLDGLNISNFNYTGAKDRLEEDSNILKAVGYSCNIYNNSITETHNGIQTGPSANSAADSTWGSGTEVYGNRMVNLSDDAIEIDTGHAISQLVSSNYADYTNSGISSAHIFSGPALVVYNTFLRFKSAGLKIGGGAEADRAGQILLYQNTMASKEPLSRAFEGGSGGGIGDVTMANNILVGATQTYKGPSTANWALSTLNSNYNVVDSSSTAGRLINWEGANVVWPTWLSSYGQDVDSRQEDPGLKNLTGPTRKFSLPDGRLKNSSNNAPSNRAIKFGRTLPGINSGLAGPRYKDYPNAGSLGCSNCYYSAP